LEDIDAPTKEGYLFVNWLKNGVEYKNTTPVNEDFTLTANWIEEPTVNEYYQITFICNNESEKISVKENETITPPKAKEIENYLFKGWYSGDEVFDFKNPKLKTVVWNCIAFPTSYYQNNTGYNSTDYWGIGGYWQTENNSTFPPTMTTGNYNDITTIIFGEKVISLPNYLCYDMSLKNIYSKNLIPPTYSSHTFKYCGSVKSVYVPMESVEQYKVKWSDFADKIVGYDFE
jgi:uncharacterized repeat protein (TIGR02543 family)